MSGLEALSLVCSIMQVISFTKELATTCKYIYDGRATVDDITQENTASIKSLLDDMDKCSRAVRQRTQNEKDLREIARKCSSAAQELQKEIQLATQYHKPGSAVKAIIGGVKSFTHKRKVKELSEKFQESQKTLETHLLVRVCMKMDALQIQQQSGFIELSETMQYFISQIADGHTKMASLINRDGMQTRQQIRQSEMRVKNSINAVHVEADTEAKRNRFLQSLRFESMNARRTDINIADEATYVSFFKSLEFTKEPTSGSAAAAWADFVDWLQSDEQIFWIQGKPGAGKSTLVKFLLQHENTPKALDKWGHNPLIVSHFFWKPGNILQRNFKGLLCSLSHQLLSSESSLVDQILAKYTFARTNDSIGDWEISHLVAIFKSTLSYYNRPIFFLIDGLDEAVDTQPLLKFLTSSITLRNTKWCIASRGEEIYKRAFSKYNGFKLNDYTRDDMLDFARKEIQHALANVQGYETMYTEQFLEELQHILVSKAEGVYLWLALALESIKRGLQNNDSEDAILSRLINLPTELEKLYADMWNRLGEDKGIYQREAAHYFNLLITQQALFNEYGKRYKWSVSDDWILTPFQIMLTQHDELQRNLLNKSYELQLSDLERKCSDVTKSISIKTAGLLVTQKHFSFFRPGLQVKAKYSQLQKYTTSTINFIHRTLFDFLRDTEFGRNILLQAPVDLVYVQLATTMLCQLRIKEMASDSKYPLAKSSGLRRGGILHCFRWVLNQAQKKDQHGVFNTLLPAYESLFEASLIPWDRRPDNAPRPCFEVLLLSDPAFQPFIKERLKKKGGRYATRVLREYMFVRDGEFFRRHDLGIDINIPEVFHGLDADINSADACFYDLPVDIGQFAGCFTYESALSEFVKLLFSNTATERLYTPHFGLYEHMRNLVAFLESLPDLNTHTSCLMWSTNTSREIQNWNLRLLLSALSVDNNKQNQVSEPVDNESSAIVITEVNSKYLIEHLLKNLLSYDTATNTLISRALKLVKQGGSKPYIKARFIILMQLAGRLSQVHRVACYKFIDEDVDVFSELEIYTQTKHGMRETYPTFQISGERVNEYFRLCEEVDVSALSTLLDQKLGACFREVSE